MVFPLFIFKAFNPLWFAIVLVGNFAIDTIVLLGISAIVLKRVDFDFYKKTIFKVWRYGLLADLMGVGHICAFGEIADLMIPDKDSGFIYTLLRGIAEGGDYGNVFYSPVSICLVISGIIVSGIAIFVFDYFRSFRKTDFTKKQKIIASLILAITTMPYTFLLSGL